MGKIDNLRVALNALCAAFQDLGMAEPAALVLKDRMQFDILSSAALAYVIMPFRAEADSRLPSICGIPLRIDEERRETRPGPIIEHIAYEIAKAEEPNMGLSWYMNDANRERCRKLARAAILAIRDSTPAMRHAGAEVEPGWGYVDGIWPAMIDEAMEEKP